MAHKKAAGTTKNGRDSGPQYLGIKVADGSRCNAGSIIVRQRGSEILPGANVKSGKDFTLFALKEGTVKIISKRKVHFDGTVVTKKIANIV
jgi:large subunit ribosomal protein L27